MRKIFKVVLTIIPGIIVLAFILIPVKAEARTLFSYFEKPTLSILGDSVSSYFGYSRIPWVFYGPYNSGAPYTMPVFNMWWQRYAQDEGYRIGIADGENGTRVTRPDDDIYSFIVLPDIRLLVKMVFQIK